MNNQLASWREGAAKSAIVKFVEDVSREGAPNFVELQARIAVFDNDGKLWCEKPIPVELVFILQRLAAMADKDETLRQKQPWKAAYEKDYAWLGNAVVKHYRGDDSDVKALVEIIRQYDDGNLPGIREHLSP